MRCGATEEIPGGSKENKCVNWLIECNNDPKVNSLKVLGDILQDIMEMDIKFFDPEAQEKDREKINAMLSKHGLSYHFGGIILGASAGGATRTLHDILKNKDLHSLDQEFHRALNSVESDPPSSLTAACSIVESLCKVYIEENPELALPSDQSIKLLWKVVISHLKLDPAHLVDQDLKKILTGLFSTIDGLGAIRTHGGSAHGRWQKFYRIEARHARLAIHAAHTLCVFVLETWEAKNIQQHNNLKKL